MKKKIMLIITTLLVGAVLLSACNTVQPQAASSTDRRLQVTGTGEVTVVPDMLTSILASIVS